jgi:hypothetical protein
VLPGNLERLRARHAAAAGLIFERRLHGGCRACSC